MRKLICLVLLLLVLKPAQAGWVIGYNGGFYPYVTRNLQAHAQGFNLNSTVLQDPMKINPFFRGITTGIRGNFEDGAGFWAITFTTRKVETGWGKNDLVAQKWRIRTNYISGEAGAGNETFKIGATVDLGGMKFQKKTQDLSTGETSKWESFYEGKVMYESGTFAGGFSLFGEVRLGGFFYMRAFSMLPIAIFDVSDDNTDLSFGYRAIHHGISIYVDLFADN